MNRLQVQIRDEPSRVSTARKVGRPATRELSGLCTGRPSIGWK